MMNNRHLTSEERLTLRGMADVAGIVEVLRCLATIVGNDHPDIVRGNDHKSALLAIAKRINEDSV